jgi:hypothetical protein
VYATNFRASADVRWPESGATIALDPLPDTREGRLDELRRWRHDIDTELATGDRAEAEASQLPLVWLFVQECRRLTLDVRAGICFDDDSPLARAVATRPAVLNSSGAEDPMGGSDMRSPMIGRDTKSEIRGVTVKGDYGKDDKKPVGGFTIGPAGPSKAPEKK